MLNKLLVVVLVLFLGKSFAQDTTKTYIDKDSGQHELIGLCTRDAFKDTSYSWWWDSEYDIYSVDSTSADSLKNKLDDYKIEVIMGTWCSDSKMQVPKLFKVLDYINFPSDSVKIICVTRDLKTDGNELDSLDIKKVPTIILYKNGEEKGRIVESPEVSLEKDMLKIVSKGT
jgi:thiol-disulfide isomerase/thioredoxin